MLSGRTAVVDEGSFPDTGQISTFPATILKWGQTEQPGHSPSRLTLFSPSSCIGATRLLVKSSLITQGGVAISSSPADSPASRMAAADLPAVSGTEGAPDRGSWTVPTASSLRVSSVLDISLSSVSCAVVSPRLEAAAWLLVFELEFHASDFSTVVLTVVVVSIVATRGIESERYCTLQSRGRAPAYRCTQVCGPERITRTMPSMQRISGASYGGAHEETGRR